MSARCIEEYVITSVTTVLVDLSASVILGSLWETTAQLALVYTLLLLCQAACRLLQQCMLIVWIC